MSTDSTNSTTTRTPTPGPSKALEQARSLGTSPVGETFEVLRVPGDEPDGLATEESEPSSEPERFVLKKISRAQLRAPDKFRQKFEALRRLEHPNLCRYRELYVGERTARITRDFVDGISLDKFLLQPITDEESETLARNSELAEATSESDEEVSREAEKVAAESSPSAGEGSSADEEAPQVEEGLSEDDREADQADQDGESADDARLNPPEQTEEAAAQSEEAPPEFDDKAAGDPDRPSTLEIPASLMEDSEAADRALDLIILRLRRIMPQLIDSLEYLHRFRHVHGSLKPENILITPSEKVVLTDYGLHPELNIPSSFRRRYASYQSPEIESHGFSPESDLYSLGAILFEALAERPFGEKRSTDADATSGGELTPLYLSEIVPHCPASWTDLIHGLLAEDRAERLSLEEVHRQLAASEQRSVNIPASVVQDRDTLFGRREVLTRLTDQAKACSQRRSMGLAVIEGETGVGKTAVVDALARWAAQHGWVVLHGRCYHRQPVVYQGWEDIVDRLVRITDELPEKARRRLESARSRASRLFPQLATPSKSPPEIGRTVAVNGLRSFFEGLSAQRPMLICLDDIHWAGRDSIRLLADLAEEPDDLRIMVVATWLPERDSKEVHPFFSEMATAPVELTRHPIQGFSKREAREYVLANAAHLSLRQKQKVLRQGGFNPLLIDELIHHSEAGLDEDSLPIDGETCSDENRDHDDGEDLDNHLTTFVQDRLTDLSRPQRLALQLLAVASGPLSAELLGRAMVRELGSQTTDLDSGREVAESLVQRRLVRRARHIEHSDDQPTRYVVIHDLCRRVIRDELGRDHRSRLCGLIADALETNGRDVDDLRFEYLRRAGRDEEASRTALHAAQSAANRFAYDRAVHLWRWLESKEELGEEVLREFATSLTGAGQFDSALRRLDKLIPHSSVEADLELRRSQISALLSLGGRRQAMEALDEAHKSLGHSYLRPSLVETINHVRRRIQSTLGRWADVTTLATDADPGREARAKSALLDFSVQTSPFLLSTATPYLATRFAHQAHRKKFGPWLGRDRLQMVGAPWLPFLAREGANLERWLDQASSVFDAAQDLRGQARTGELRALMARHRGDLSAAVEFIEGAQAHLESSPTSDALIRARLIALRIDVALLQGDLATADNLVARLTHHVRHRRWLSCLAALSACDRDLLVGELENAQLRLEPIDDFIGDDRNCLLHLWVMERRTRINVGLGRPEVAVAQWDLLLDREYSPSLIRLPPSRLIIYHSMCRALAALAQRQLHLDEPRRRETLTRLKSSLRCLADLEPWMGVTERASLYRFHAQLELIRRRSARALRHVQKSLNFFPDDSLIISQAMSREALGVVMTRREDPEARSTLDEARKVYAERRVFLPLAMDGWPVPSSHSILKDDP